MAKLAIDRASIAIVSRKKSGDFHSKSGDREVFIILSKIVRSPAKSGDLEALQLLERLMSPSPKLQVMFASAAGRLSTPNTKYLGFIDLVTTISSLSHELVIPRQVTHIPMCGILYFLWHSHQLVGTTSF